MSQIEHALTTDLVLVDIIEFSTLNNYQQLMIIEHISKIYKKMLDKIFSRAGLPLEDMILGIIPTGDGFYSILNPQLMGYGTILALSFTHLSTLIAQQFEYFKGVRIAVHTGDVHQFKDILGHTNFVGDGLNECARYLEFKDFTLSTVIVSDVAYQSLEYFLIKYPEYQDTFRTHQFKRGSAHTIVDKHGYEHVGYVVWFREGGIINPPKAKRIKEMQRYKIK